MFKHAIYDITVWIFTRIISLFFKEINSRGSHQIPDKGPVIFVVGPHANQFVDPLVLLKHSKRRVGFLVAKKSYDRPYIGKLARAVNSIPVARPQDYTVKGNGRVYFKVTEKSENCVEIYGHETTFERQMRSKDSIVVNGVNLDVKSVVSDTKALLSRPVPPQLLTNMDNNGFEYKIIPHLDQNKVYEAVHSRLHNGECIGIFPEGGSHDRAEMLPLKAGVTIMALGAMAEYPGLNVKIVPCGLHYFHPHKFRSRAVIEFAEPITISPEYVEKFKKGGIEKREACGALLEQITQSLHSVTINASDYESLQVIQAARRLYKPEDSHLSLHEVLELTRKFATAYGKLRDHPKVKEFARNVLEYNRQLAIFGLRDHQVMKTAISTAYAFEVFIWRFITFSILMIFSLPGLFLNLPIIILTSKISRGKAKEALKASSVKIAGRDVLATWKLMVALVVTPIFYSIYSILGSVLLKHYMNVEYSPLLLFVGLYICLSILSYCTILFAETSVGILMSLSPLILAILPGYKQSSTRLRRFRQFLESEVIALSNELGPKVFEDFDEGRLIEEDERRRLFLLNQLNSSIDSIDVSPDPLNWKEVSEDERDDVFFN